MTSLTTEICPLCGAGFPRLYHTDATREYLACQRCALVYVPAHFHLTPELEKAEYDLHQNDPADSRYRTFLARLYEPMLQHLKLPASGLDFGCGPGPALAEMFKESGFNMNLFDPYYFPDRSVLTDKYDFITCTEVLEHLAKPAKEMHRLFAMLRLGGMLGIMTKLVLGREAFKNWHYIHDPTHIAFYSKATFEWIASRYHVDLEFVGSDVILMWKRQVPFRN